MRGVFRAFHCLTKLHCLQGERTFSSVGIGSPVSDFFRRGHWWFPLLGERVKMRASVICDCMDTAETVGWTTDARNGFPLPFGRGEGQGDGSSTNRITKQRSNIETNHLCMPVVFGFCRPRLLLSVSLRQSLDVRGLRLVFRHEFTHVRQRAAPC